jgi:mono/diheme cytochrome c family protein
MFTYKTLAPIVAAVALAVVLVPASRTLADGLALSPVKDPIAAKECSACHMLYPAGLLPARSWKALMGGLKNHFGDNAELDAEATGQITSYLTANAADAGRGGGRIMRDVPPEVTPQRITDLPYFKRKHDKRDRISPATLERRGAKSPGDCAACHKEAANGYFDDDD